MTANINAMGRGSAFVICEQALFYRRAVHPQELLKPMAVLSNRPIAAKFSLAVGLSPWWLVLCWPAQRLVLGPTTTPCASCRTPPRERRSPSG